ncbi:MAG: sigma 54-interacting transcriptional regulator [Sandaracinaceae bacterium]
MSTPEPQLGTRILSRDGQSTLVRRRASLSVVGGPSVELTGTALRVGSDPENDLVLEDAAVSARHFQLTAEEAGFRLRDLESTNGTFVGALRCRDVVLGDAVEIRCGTTRLHFQVFADEVELALSRRTDFGRLLGHSPPMRAAFAVLERAAKTELTVLVFGESGTGKELAARGLHDKSKREAGPFVVLDCGAAAPSLLESQLFGHVRGAFTGAESDRPGVFEEADGGTLVLDEIGELPFELQPKLLRALEARTITRIGEHTARSFDVRFVASTHRNLEAEVAAGRFRQDLYYRLSGLVVRLPPLRDRPEEIPRLVAGFLAALDADVDVSSSTMQALMSYAWPGNVRELRNVVERMVALADLSPSAWMPASMASAEETSQTRDARWDLPFHDAKQRWIDGFEHAYLTRLLKAHGDNVSEAARVAGLSRQSCYRLMRKHGVAPG